MTEDELEAELKAQASAASREIAIQLTAVLEVTASLDQWMADKPPLVRDRQASIQHILTTFKDESLAIKQGLVSYLYYPHYLKALREA